MLVAYVLIGLLMAGIREAFRCGVFTEMTRWTSVRTNARYCLRGRGGLA